jgi:hypothetical protein
MNYNPFNGGYLVVKKQGISKKQFDSKYKDYVRDEYHTNEFYEVWVKGDDVVLVKTKK